jgi:hypothetical protein
MWENPLVQIGLLGLATAMLVWASNHRKLRQRGLQRLRSQPASAAPTEVSHAKPLELAQQSTLPNAMWLSQLLHALHLLIIGHSQGGKTTLIHELATRLAAAGVQVIVCDLDAAPGLWPGCAVHGYANDLGAINRVLGELRLEVERRRQLRGSGRRRTFPPLYLVVDEYQDVGRASACPEARPLVEDILRRGGKLNLHLIIGVQDKLVRTMGLEGQGDLRRNFTFVVEVRASRDGRRWASLTDPGNDEATATYEVPQLVNLDNLVEAAIRHQPALVSVRGQPPMDSNEAVETAENRLENFRRPEMRFTASESEFSISDGDFSVEEIAQIAAMIALGGKGKTEIVQAMPRYSGRKHKAYVVYYERVRAAIGASPDGSCVS